MIIQAIEFSNFGKTILLRRHFALDFNQPLIARSSMDATFGTFLF